MQININSDAVVKFTDKLKQMAKFDLPIAVRITLNDAAFDVKQNTMPATAKVFKSRQPNFFKANSKVESATGFDVNKMFSTVGFFENKLKEASTNYAVKDLEQQENGGTIESKSFIAMKQARNSKGLVKPNARLKAMRENAINAHTGKGSKKQRFIRASIMAVKLGKPVLGNLWKGNRTLSRIDSIQMNMKTRKLQINRTALYTFKKDRTVKVASTNFMKRASHESGLKMEIWYIKNAEKRILKSIQ